MTKSPPNPDTKSALLEAAQGLFSQKGYAAVSTREVADAAGVNLGSIQYYFGSKAKLFIETIRHMMETSGHDVRAQMSFPDCGTCVHSSSTRLANFIKSFLNYLLVPHGPQPCRMMIREIFSETSEDPEMFETLVSTMSDEFAKPLEEMIGKLVAVVAPRKNSEEIAAAVRSILGQCSYYATHRPFQERLMGVSLSSSQTINQVGSHIAMFSLAALGVERSIIESVVKEVFSETGVRV